MNFFTLREGNYLKLWYSWLLKQGSCLDPHECARPLWDGSIIRFLLDPNQKALRGIGWDT